MKKQNLSGLKLNKKSISDLSYYTLGGKAGVETEDGLKSTMGPCQGGTMCCNGTMIYCTAIVELCGL